MTVTPNKTISPNPLAQVLGQSSRLALLIGNGVNRFSNDKDSSWEDLLEQIAQKQSVTLSGRELREMSNTELFDILDLAKPAEDRSNLQKMFCDLMRNWKYAHHHSSIVSWAQRHARPIITVNFDENLSRCVPTSFFRQCGRSLEPRFTDYYPWRSYFGDQQIHDSANGFAIWHAHGMMRYARSIQLGLTHYMGSVQRARAAIYWGEDSLVRYLQGKSESWRGLHTWLHVFFFSDIAIIGFGFGKDETLFRWLFLERARLSKRYSSVAKKAWFIVEDNPANHDRKQFFKHLGIEIAVAQTRSQIYESAAWDG